MRTALLPFCRVHSQAFFAINPVHALGVYLPAFMSQHHRQPSGTVTRPVAGQLAQALPKFALRIATALILVDPARDAHQPTSAAFIQLVRLADAAHHVPPRGGLQAFFDNTCCKMCLSRVRSATSAFSLRFSSRNWRSSRSSLNPTP